VESEWELQELEQVRREISERLKPICGDMAPEEFNDLVERMARVQRKFERYQRDEFFPKADDLGDAHGSG
jgi:hypothetical protein